MKAPGTNKRTLRSIVRFAWALAASCIFGISIPSLIAQSTNCAEGTSAGAKEAERKAREYLQPLLHIGEPLTNIIARFGPPIDKSETPAKELVLYFMFRDNEEKAIAAEVGGFTGFFTNNVLTSWEPIYETWDLKCLKSTVKHPPVSFHSDKAILSFNLVSQEPKDGWIYIDDTKFPKLGYINKSPDLSVFTGQYTVYESADKSKGQISFDITPADGEKLKALTTGNVGQKMAILSGSQIVTAASINTPISTGKFQLDLPNPSFSNVVHALTTTAQ
jgi:hypothetical protein